MPIYTTAEEVFKAAEQLEKEFQEKIGELLRNISSPLPKLHAKASLVCTLFHSCLV